MFGKVFASLWDGSLLGLSSAQLVFVYLIAHSDSDGVVEVVHEKIAFETGLPLSDVHGAIAQLMAPDPRSRTPDDEGRRIVPLDDRGWGWRIVNRKRYAEMRDEAARREQNRQAQRRHRSGVSTRQHVSASVSTCQHVSAPSAQTETETETEKSTHLATDVAEIVADGHVSMANGRAERRDWEQAFVDLFWPEYPRKVKQPRALKAWMAIKPQTQATFDEIMAGLERWTRYWDERNDRQFIDHPATWLNGRCWGDDPK